MTEPQYPTTEEQAEKETFTTPADEPRASYRILDTLRDKMSHEAAQDLGKRVSEATRAFPELSDQTITVGLLYPEDDAKGRAFSHNRLINFPPDQYTSNVTIYHELGHVAIRIQNEDGAGLPKTSEEFCSIFSMSRMPPNAVDEQRIPYLGKSPKGTERFPAICERALEYRENNRNYIQKCKEWLEI